MKRMIPLMGAALFGALTFAEGKNDWENPAVNEINRLPPRTYAMPLASEADALSDALEPETPYKKSLNGTWKIKWVGDSARRPKDFFSPGYDDSDWNTIDVPSCVEMRGFGSPGYTNVKYPHANHSQPSDPAFASVRDRDSDTPDYNPVSSYRTTFTVPENWAGRDVILRFDGVYSAFYVWVNGRLAGYAEDSKLPSEFDVTALLNPEPGSANTLAVQVFRWCDGSYLEDQDMFRFSGIFRDVTLWAKPKDGIWDFAVRTKLSADYASGTVALEGLEGDWSATLYDGGKNPVATLTPEAPSATIAGVALWSAEKPNLYTLVVRKGEDVRMKRVGFKEQKVVGDTVFVNGKAIKLKGVNRHETSPKNGRTVSLADMLEDIELMKRSNIDTVRTSHYPNHHLWYDLCDRYGIYLVAEANVEGHEPGYGEQGLGLFPEWQKTIVERNARHVAFYRNNVSVTFWSLGNETGHGANFVEAAKAVRALDPTRILHWERGNEIADVESQMYMSVEWTVARGKAGGKPFFHCEYAHAMGNAIGNLQDYWDAIYAYPALCGGCIWDWADQAVWKQTDRVDPKTGKRERYLAYGGDFDEFPNDGPFCDNGIVDPFRNVNAKLLEVAHVYRNLVVTKKGEGYELWNRYGFTSADAFAGEWSLLEEGVEIAKGTFEVPAVPPLGRGEVTFAGLDEARANSDRTKEQFLNVSFLTKTDAPGVPKGWVVARDQIALPREEPPPAEEGAPKKMYVEEKADTVTVECARTTAVFDRATGTLRMLFIKGVNVIDNPAGTVVGGPRLTCMRAMTDNDRWMAEGDIWGENRAKAYRASGLTQLSYHPGKIRVDKEARTVTVTVDVAGAKGCGFTHECAYVFNADGSVTLKNKVTPYGRMPIGLPRLGLTLHLPPRLEQMTYYGRGPEENYIDRNTASFVGRYSSTVREQYVEYIRPQDNGAKTDVRWAEFTDQYGRGVRFSSPNPFFLQALHYGWEDLDFSRHVNGQRRYRSVPVPREDIILNLDVRQTGLGGASCGPAPMAKYCFDPNEPVSWEVTIEAAKMTKK